MKKVATSIVDLIGNTPLLHVMNYQKHHALEADILVKIESFNPGGSIKDRVAYTMIEQAEKEGLVGKDTTIIEPTSGNTGIGLALVCAARGYKLILTMPETMSIERRKVLSALGAEIVLTPGNEGMKGAITKATLLAKSYNKSFIPQQFENPNNPLAHRLSTAKEILEDTEGKVDIFVCGVGTGGTLTGIAEVLKEYNPSIQTVAVEPKDSPVLSGGAPGSHAIQGIGAGFIPKILNQEIIDKIDIISSEEAYIAARELAKYEGVLVGISAGAALAAATKEAKRIENKGKTIVVILPDTGDRYLSTDLFLSK